MCLINSVVHVTCVLCAGFCVFTALHGMHSDGNSVCPSVKRVDCDKTEESCI